MAIGVPVTRGPGVLAFNACRIYSANNYPYLVRMSTRHSVNGDKSSTMELDHLFLKYTAVYSQSKIEKPGPTLIKP